MKIRPLATSFLLLVLISVAEAGLPEVDQTRKTLEDIRERIRQTSQTLEEKKSTERDLLEDLKTVKEKVAESRRRLARQQDELTALEGRIAEKRAKVASLRRDALALEGRVRQRLAILYKSGDIGLAGLLFNSTSPARAAENYQFMGQVVRRDRELLERYRQQVNDLEMVTRFLGDLEDEKKRTLASLERDRRNLGQAEKLKRDLITEVRRDQKNLDQALRQLKAKAEDLAALLKKLESAQTGGYTPQVSLFSAQKGKLPWPVSGPVRIGYGQQKHPELGTLYDSQGLEIAAAGGLPVTSVADGSVIYASWFKGFGNLLVVDHGDSYYTLYAQAERLVRRVGDRVRKGETLAFTDRAGEAGLYFEIRLHGTPLDPTAWLVPR